MSATTVVTRSGRNWHLPLGAKLVGQGVQPLVRTLAHFLALDLLERADECFLVRCRERLVRRWEQAIVFLADMLGYPWGPGPCTRVRNG